MNSEPHFQSLRLRLLAPIIFVAFLAAISVAVASYWLGSKWATEELQSRFAGIKSTLSDSNFPLTASVLDLLADLTQTELVALDSSGRIRQSTINVDASRLSEVISQQQGVILVDPNDSNHRYRVLTFNTAGSNRRSDGVNSVAVLFDEPQLDASRKRAALLPLITGLSTIFALSSITLWLTSRLVARLGKLQWRVERVAGGDFESAVCDDVGDEIGRLGRAVDLMAGQLDRLWKSVHRQQSEKLLHQIAGGMAHQIRNSLTGARMAVELHASDCDEGDDEGIRVAIHQIELSEDYVRRLLLVASGRQDEDRPTEVQLCFEDVRTSLSPIAKHLRIEIEWNVMGEPVIGKVKDGPTWVAAVNNLIHNAMQAGDHVQVTLCRAENDRVRVCVRDNGPGIEDSVVDELFEPFVTSKPEGMGLGLPVVKRAAQRLGGNVQFRRDNGETIFEFDAKLESDPT